MLLIAGQTTRPILVEFFCGHSGVVGGYYRLKKIRVFLFEIIIFFLKILFFSKIFFPWATPRGLQLVFNKSSNILLIEGDHSFGVESRFT